jgi:uncharacterized protein YgiM (DUF1202 family)
VKNSVPSFFWVGENVEIILSERMWYVVQRKSGNFVQICSTNFNVEQMLALLIGKNSDTRSNHRNEKTF